MAEMLTAKDVQLLLQVDRSTVYRMAEAGKLPAMKVGKQWRFPEDQIEYWLQRQATVPVVLPSAETPNSVNDLAKLLPADCVQLIQDSYADILGVMLVVTDIEGNPITQVSNACGLFELISERPLAVQKCVQSWQEMGTLLTLQPEFKRSHLGLECARSMVRVGTELKGMVVAGCIAPKIWPPTAETLDRMATDLTIPTTELMPHLESVHRLSAEQRTTVLTYLPRIANIISHIIDERKQLVGRLAQIAQLTTL